MEILTIILCVSVLGLHTANIILRKGRKKV